MLSADYIVVGSGVTGATIARLLADAGREVIVLERRSSVGGNVRDLPHSSGIIMHAYGPHYFRTSSEEIWRFVTRFSNFHPYEAVILTNIDGKYEHWPIVDSCITRYAGERWSPAFVGIPTNFEEASLSRMPITIYEKFVDGYTRKQWGVAPRYLSAKLAERFEIRSDGDVRLSRHKYQGLPANGYHTWINQMLEDVPVLLNTDFVTEMGAFRHRKMLVFTGPVDELFSFRLGRLQYRAQHRVHQFFPNINYLLPAAQVNNPGIGQGAHVRSLEWKHLMPRSRSEMIKGTLITTETPYTATNPDTYEYPFPDSRNRQMYLSYAALARQVPSLLVCGRLGEYRYLDMDQAIGRALRLGKGIIRCSEHANVSHVISERLDAAC